MAVVAEVELAGTSDSVRPVRVPQPEGGGRDWAGPESGGARKGSRCSRGLSVSRGTEVERGKGRGATERGVGGVTVLAPPACRRRPRSASPHLPLLSRACGRCERRLVPAGRSGHGPWTQLQRRAEATCHVSATSRT